VSGWTYEQSLVVLAWFSLLKAVLEGGVTPSLTAVVEGVRNGSLDFVLLKPADAQFLVSTRSSSPGGRRLPGRGGIFAIAFQKMGRWPAGTTCAGGLLLVVAVLLLYSIWILVVSAAFWVVRMDNLSYLFGSIFDAARWPIDAFKSQALKLDLHLRLPAGPHDHLPGPRLLGKLDGQNTGIALAGGVALRCWRVWCGRGPSGSTPRPARESSGAAGGKSGQKRSARTDTAPDAARKREHFSV
jgi:ABC-2 type transport system permease protein